MTDRFETNGMPNYDKLGTPARESFSFTKSDTVDETELCQFVHCVVSGDIKVLLADDTEPVTLPVLSGAVYPLRIKRLYTTGTTAQIIGMI